MDDQVDQLKLLLWDSLLTAELNATYWDKMWKKYYRRMKMTDVFLAVCTSSTVASWTIWQTVDWLWKALSALSTLVAIVVATANWKKELGEMSVAKTKWSQINLEYQEVWEDLKRGLQIDGLRSRYKTIRRKESGANDAEPPVELNVKLRNQSDHEVRVARRL